jgi:MFS family permease
MTHNTREYLIMIISGTITMFAGGFVWPIFAAYVRIEFNAPLQLVGLAVSGYFLLRMVTEFPIGVLSDRTGPKIPIVAGRILAVFGAFVSFQTKNVGFLIIARMIWGIGDASFFCIGTAYVSKLFSSEKRGRALGTFQGIEMIGNLFGQALGGYFIRGSQTGPVRLQLRSLLPSWKTLRRVMNRTIITICFVNLICMVVMNGLVGTILPLFVTEDIGISLSRYSILVSLSTVGNICGNLLGGLLSDKFGRKRILILGFAIGLAAISGFIVFRSFAPLMVAMFLMGSFWGTVYGVAPAYIADNVAPEFRGVGIGIYRTFFDFGGLVGPVTISTIAGFFGGTSGYIYSFYFAVILVLGAIALAMTLRKVPADAARES